MARGLCVAQDYLAYGYVAQARQPSITLRDSKPVNYAVLTRDEHSTFRRQPPRRIRDFLRSWLSPVSSVSPARRRLSCEVALVAGVLFLRISQKFAKIKPRRLFARLRPASCRDCADFPDDTLFCCRVIVGSLIRSHQPPQRTTTSHSHTLTPKRVVRSAHVYHT